MLSANEIQKISEILKMDLEIFVAENLSKEQIHHHVLLKTKSPFKLLRPDVSISHTKDFGGFAWTRTSGVCLGFDIELIERVKPETIRRVSAETELMQAPSPAHLWSAKEAAFKALRGEKQPSVVSEITIDVWTKIDSHIETFRIKDSKTPIEISDKLGCSVKKNLHILSFFIVHL